MKSAGIREARHKLSDLVQEVRRGRQILLTDRGRPVAQLVSPPPAQARPFPGCAAFRRTMPRLGRPLSATVLMSREDREA